MQVKKFSDFLNENVHDTPEEYVKTALTKLKRKIENYFEIPEKTEKDVITMSDALKKGKEKESEKSKISFAELGLSLESSEFSKYSSVFDSIKFIFKDETSRYDLFITIPLEEAVPKDKTKDFSDGDIKSCFLKFKKYDLTRGDELVGQINKNVEVALVDDNLIVDLKIELEDKFGEEGEKLEIEV
jgi:hypothetical protein